MKEEFFNKDLVTSRKRRIVSNRPGIGSTRHTPAHLISKSNPLICDIGNRQVRVKHIQTVVLNRPEYNYSRNKY